MSGNKDEIRPEMPEDEDRPITKLHIPYDMIIDPDRPQKPEKVKMPLVVAVRWWCVALSWLLVSSGALFILRARPLGFNIFVEMQGHLQNQVWDYFYITAAQCVMGAAALGSAIEWVYLFLREKKSYLSLIFPFVSAVVLLIVTLFL